MQRHHVTRIHEGYGQTPALTLERNNQIVVLIGLIHFAPQKYFEEIRRRIQVLEENRYVVLYEDIEEHKLFLTSRLSRAKSQSLISIHKDSYRALRRKYGLVYQGEVLKVLPKWICADDMSAARKEVDSSVASFGGWDTYYPVVEAYYRRNVDVEFLRRGVYSTFSEESYEMRRRNPSYHGMPESMVGFRDTAAARCIREHAKSTNVVSYWGLAHLPGISRKLYAAGFRRVRTEWISVVKM